MPTAPVTQLVMPLVRLGTVPPFEPPYDDEATTRGDGSRATRPAGRRQPPTAGGGRDALAGEASTGTGTMLSGANGAERRDDRGAPARNDDGSISTRGAAPGAGARSANSRAAPGAGAPSANSRAAPGAGARSANSRAAPRRVGGSQAAMAAAAPSAASRPVITNRVSDPAAREAIRRLVSATVEVLNGFRPASHLRPLIEPVAALEIIEELGKRAIAADGCRSRGKAVDDRIRVRQIRICEPIAGVAEAAVVLGRGDIRWAMALRWEYLRGAWLCTIALVI